MGRKDRSTSRTQPPSNLWSKAGHGLRQPIQAALYIAHVLKASAGNDPATARLVPALEEALKGLQVQIELLTELAGTMQIASRPLRLDQVIAGVVAQVEPIAVGQGARLRVLHKTTLSVSSDQRLLTLALSGLLQNALRLRTEGPVLAGIRPKAEMARFEVYFVAAPLSEAQRQAAFITLTNPGDGRPTGAPALGLGFIAHICQLLGYALEISSPSAQVQRFALELQRA